VDFKAIFVTPSSFLKDDRWHYFPRVSQRAVPTPLTFYPPLQRLDAQQIACVQAVETVDGKGWQRWSRHRIGTAVWAPGVDNLESHFAYVQDWLARETER
jgi:hypothetical protein